MAKPKVPSPLHERQAVVERGRKMRQGRNDAAYFTYGVSLDYPGAASSLEDGVFAALRQAAIEAGIVKAPPSEEDRILLALLDLWRRADSVTRHAFDYHRTKIQPMACDPGPPAWLNRDAPPELIVLTEALKLSDIAGLLGVSRQTVGRWAHGDAKPRPGTLRKMRELNDPRHTITCAVCGHAEDANRWDDRTFRCRACRIEIALDTNRIRNLRKALKEKVA